MNGFRFKTFMLWVFVFLSGSAYSSYAQESDKAWYIPELGNFGAGVHGGYQQSQDSDNGMGFGGAHLRFRVFSFLGVEVAGDSTTEYFRDKSVVVTETPVSLTGLIYPFGAPMTFLPWPITPYLAGGATWMYFRTDFRKALATPPTNLQAASGVEYNKAPGWHEAIGLDFALRKNVIFNLEYRATFWNFRENIDNATVRAALPDISTNNYTVRGGLTFLFH